MRDPGNEVEAAIAKMKSYEKWTRERVWVENSELILKAENR